MKNPFKLWGSYIGAIIGFFAVGWIRFAYDRVYIVGYKAIWNTFYLIDKVYTLNEFIIFVLGGTLLGAIIGYLIHNMVKK
jgi:hypothetical protein